MYNNINCKIFHKNFNDDYYIAFKEFFVKTVYGDSLVLGESLVKVGNNE